MATRNLDSPWRRARERDLARQAQFEAVFQEHWPRIYAILARLVGDRDHAEDLALETFWRLYTLAPQKGPQNVAGWLYRVATNLGLNALRAEKRRRQYEDAAMRLDPGPTASSNDPHHAAVRQDEVSAVRRALAAMRQPQAELLMLRHAGLSYREVADALGLAPNSIGPLLARAERDFEEAYLRLEKEWR